MMKYIILNAIVVFIWLLSSDHALAQNNQVCLTKAQLSTKGSILAEFSVDNFKLYSDTPYNQLIIGDKISRIFFVYSNAKNPSNACYTLQASGFGWTSADSSKKRKKPDESGLLYNKIGGYVCGNSLNICGPIKSLPKKILKGKGRLLSYGMVNQFYDINGRERPQERTIWRYYRDRNGNMGLLESDPEGGFGWQSSKGRVISSVHVAGDGNIFANWLKYAPVVPIEYNFTDVINANFKASGNSCLTTGDASKNLPLIWTGNLSTKQPLTLNLYGVDEGNWRLTSQNKDGSCNQFLFGGVGLKTADYVRDKWTQANNIRSLVHSFSKTKKYCDRLKETVQRVNGKSLLCYSHPQFIESLNNNNFHTAMVGQAHDLNGEWYNLTLLANGMDGRFEFVRTNREGALQRVFSGLSFTFSDRYRSKHFASREAGQAAEAALAAAEESRRIARLKRERQERQARLEAQQRENARLARQRARAAARAEQARIAALTPEQRKREKTQKNINTILSSMDETVHTDSKQWLIFKYAKGSMRNLRMRRGNSEGEIILVADYDYASPFNPSASAHVEFHTINGKLRCIKFWDTGCRAPFSESNWSPALVTAGIFGAFLALEASSRK